MSDMAIQVNGLGKRYRIGKRLRYKTLRDSLADAWRTPFHALSRLFNPQATSHEPPSDTSIWALKDVSFEIKRGEVVGIIGRNGAGKSTLLKILSRITEPTEGYADINGRVGSLLELGTGFHPELTGRENVYLNGAMLGMRKREIDRKFDEIVAFAELEQFLDTPVKHYSDGMYVRLAFAVATHLEPEILLIDEVLAVGDAAFQKKCLGKMGDVAQGGRTVLFVSHSMAAIASLCQSAILVDAGEVKLAGPAEQVIESYLTSLTHLSARACLRTTTNRRGTGEVSIVEAAILDRTGEPCSCFQYDDDICFELTLERFSESPDLICVVWIQTLTGIPVLHLASHDDPSCKPFRVTDRSTMRCVIKRCKLYPGTYVVSLWTGPSHNHDTDFVMDVLQFRVEQGRLLRRGFDMSWKIGVFHSESSWSVNA